ncbi:MAG TPA: acyl transferase [Bacteroidia bacterium]|nr:acyl transferase [Bacteroidia bacterium]HNS12744.1 acyl transferase [Bacteroidia bacterium]
MGSREKLLDRVFSIQNHTQFEEIALDVFRYQADKNNVYKNYLQFLQRECGAVKSIEEIPFLPIEIFKSQKVLSFFDDAQLVFSSSATTGAMQSLHYVPDPNVYEESFLKTFSLFYGDPMQYCILALLPSYLERSGSSLIYMMQRLIEMSKHPSSGFYLNEHAKLSEILRVLQVQKQKTILIGVTFALIDFADKYSVNFPELIVMETGGMKGQRTEMVREDVHSILKKSFGIDNVHSEYGMTELLSQAYSDGEGLFSCPPWMSIVLREPNDPFSKLGLGKTGGINIIDLANIDSCSFIETQDLGKIHPDGRFEVLGRFDTSDLRGCNLMVI